MNIINQVNNLIPLNYPLNFIISSLILVFGFSLFFPLFGKLIQTIEQFEFNLFQKFFGQRLALIIINRVTFIGTIIHEYAHALFAWLTGALVTKISVIDLFKGNQLGHVEFATRGGLIKRNFQLFFASAAPVIIGIISTSLLLIYVLPQCNTPLYLILFWYIIISIINHSSMSDQDLSLYKKGALTSVPFLVVIIFILQICLQKA